MPYKCLDFASMGFPTGMLVQRSAHYQKDRCQTGRPQVGVITRFDVLANDDQLPVLWPTVAWEGVPTGPSSTNPSLVDVCRPADKKRAIYVDIDV